MTFRYFDTKQLQNVQNFYNNQCKFDYFPIIHELDHLFRYKKTSGCRKTVYNKNKNVIILNLSK